MSPQERLVFLGTMGARWYCHHLGLDSLVQLLVSSTSTITTLPCPRQINFFFFWSQLILTLIAVGASHDETVDAVCSPFTGLAGSVALLKASLLETAEIINTITPTR